MAAILRYPLAIRPSSHQVSPSPSVQTVSVKLPSAKRSRSPDGAQDVLQSSKRPRGVDQPLQPVREESKKDKERRRAERETDFRVKYTRAFPGWVFYFDADPSDTDAVALSERLADRVQRMDARVEGFFSKEVTHLITSQSAESFANKENSSKLQPKESPPPSLLRSPIKLKSRNTKDVPTTLPGDHLLKKAMTFDIKIWSLEKLESVLNRCNAPPACLPRTSSIPNPSHGVPAPTPRERSLTRLLEAERIHGTTERDPAQKRNDYIYFSKSSYYVLVEDMNQEIATIAALEYPIHKDQEGRDKGSWPVLHCHPKARGPFVEYNDREERRREKADKLEADREWERERRKAKLLAAKKKHAQQELLRQGDLRRSVSMSNIQRRASFPQAGIGGFVDLDADLDDETGPSANASGYLASGTYMAASGNSVSITSTTGTTSTAGHSFRPSQLNSNLKGLMQQQVVTSRRASFVTTSAAKKENVMGPPPIPEKRNILLRKSRSTNTLRLPKREEGMKPGYCESCRTKFEDFSLHIIGRKHRKFAADDNNFASLDTVLSRVRRRTMKEVEAEQKVSVVPHKRHSNRNMASLDEPAAEDIQWDDWVENNDTL